VELFLWPSINKEETTNELSSLLVAVSLIYPAQVCKYALVGAPDCCLQGRKAGELHCVEQRTEFWMQDES